MPLLLIGWVLNLTVSAAAQGFSIRANNRDVAPHGHTRSGGYFVPNSDRSRLAIPKQRGEVCPHGFTPSGGTCLATR